MEKIETGYKCKNCEGYLCGYYVRLKEKLYFRGKCKCSYWLVKSTHLKDTFDIKEHITLDDIHQL